MSDLQFLAIAYLLAANACANLSATDSPIVERVFHGFGTAFLIGGMLVIVLGKP